MLLFPVLTSILGVLWQREHLANSGVDMLESIEEDSDELPEDAESSLVTCNTFCTGLGFGRGLCPWAADVCIDMRFAAMSEWIGS